MIRKLRSFLTSTLEGSKWPVSRHVRFNPWKYPNILIELEAAWKSEPVWTLQRGDDEDNKYYNYTALLTTTVAVILCASKIYWLVQDEILRPHGHKIWRQSLSQSEVLLF